MTRHHQLKNEARRAEQKSDWGRAIELYKSVIRMDEDRESGADVGVYNRIGDLYLRMGDMAAAVEYYEQAADLYAANGLHTSAIALCNKILRIAPDRHEVYGRLAKLHASTGLLVEARNAFLRFSERMREANRLSEALETVQDLVSLTGDEDLRTSFAEQLAGAGLTAQAVAQLRLVYRSRVADGRGAQEIRDRIVALDPDADPIVDIAPPPPRATPTPEPAVSEIDLRDAVTPPQMSSDPPAQLVESHGPTAASPELPDAGSIGEAGFESVLSEFRSQVRDIVEESDHAVHYDLGVAYMGMDLLDEAIGEFQLAMKSPALMQSAHALLGECIRALGEPVTDAPATETVSSEEAALPLGQDDDFMLGQSVDLGAPSDPVSESAVDSPAREVPGDEASEDLAAGSAEAEEDELAEMLFQARLAQHRARTASEAGEADHHAHLQLGLTYQRMGLATEAVRDLAIALQGPSDLREEALEALERAAAAEGIEAAALCEALGLLIENGREDAAVAAGRDYVNRPAIREVDRQAVLALLPAEEADATPESAPSRPAASTDTLAELGGIFEELDSVAGQELNAALGLEGDELIAGMAAPAAAPAGDDANALFGEAEGLRAAGRMDEAASHYYRALELFEKMRDAVHAIRTVDRLLALRPDDVVLHHQKTEFAIMMNDRELLISAYLDLAACLRRQNGFRSARTVYGRILDLDSQNAEARAGIAAVEADELARERRRRQRAPVAPDQPATSESAAPASPGEFDQIFDELREPGEESSAVTAEDFDSRFELGVAFRQMEMWDEAAREFKAAAQGMTDPLPAYERLGECLNALRRYDEARRTLGVAVTHPGEEADKVGILFQLGVAHLRSGDREGARSFLQRVVQIDPTRADAAQLLSSLPA